MNLTDLSDQMKYSVEELLLGDKTVQDCDFTKHGLLLNHLVYKDGNSIYPFSEYVRRVVRTELGLAIVEQNVVLINSEPAPIQYN